MLESYKLKKISVKTEKGKLVALQVELGDGSVSPIFGEQELTTHWDIPQASKITKISIKEVQAQNVSGFEIVEGPPAVTGERMLV